LTLEAKRRELIENCEILMAESFEDIDKCMGKVKGNLNVLADFD
jgi:hypothetical protein